MPKKVPKSKADREGNKGIGGRGGGSAKRSGTYFENQVEDYFNEMSNVTAKRIIGSGAFGTISREPRLLGDVYINWAYLDKPILAECKFGYGGKTQITIKKEWVDKIVEEAELANRHPALLVKFKGARGGNSKLIAFTWDTWKKIMEYFEKRIDRLEVENERLRANRTIS